MATPRPALQLITRRTPTARPWLAAVPAGQPGPRPITRIVPGTSARGRLLLCAEGPEPPVNSSGATAPQHGEHDHDAHEGVDETDLVLDTGNSGTH